MKRKETSTNEINKMISSETWAMHHGYEIKIRVIFEKSKANHSIIPGLSSSCLCLLHSLDQNEMALKSQGKSKRHSSLWPISKVINMLYLFCARKTELE